MRIRKTVVAVTVAAVALVGTAGSVAYADRPGPGDKQCIPGQHGSPKPGFKAGACSNR